MMVAVPHRDNHFTLRERASPATRLATVGLAVLGLLAVVALASRGRLGGGGRGAAPSASLLDYGFTIFVVLYVLAIPFTIWAYLIQQRESRAGGGGRQRRGLLQSLAVIAGFVAIALAFVELRRSHGLLPQLQAPPGLAGKGKKKLQPGAVAHQPSFQWTVLIVFAGLGAAGVAAYVVHRRSRGPLRDAPGLAEQLAFALDDAIDDVRAESDPRRAVIKAYARMEEILGAHGLPRRAEEAPYEYLARALLAVDASAASAERLTGLYERARFSHHEIDATMREHAIGALTDVRDELREAAAA
jgi:hypothetical protein